MVEKDFDIILFYSLKAGNEDALDLLFKKYYSPLCQYTQTFINDSVFSEDIVTDLFTDIWIKRSKIEIKQNFKSYLYKSAKNAALSYIRKKKINTVSIEDIKKFDVGSSQSPHTKYAHKQTDLYIQTILKKIPPRSREVFILHRFEEMKYREISLFLNISIKTVENHMGKALKILRNNKDLLKKLLTSLLIILSI